MSNPYHFFLSVGLEDNQPSKSQGKIIKLINLFIILWYHGLALMSLMAILFRKEYAQSLYLNFGGLLFVIACHFCNHIKKYRFASIGLTLYSFFHIFMITNFIAPERFVEFFYLVIPCGFLIWSNSEKHSWIILIIAIILFHTPFYYIGAYQSEGVLFLPPILTFLFLINFVIVLYFKRLNIKSELLLANEKKKVESDKVKLEELSRFKDKFFINLSHEIRTPLTLINGNINQLESTQYPQKSIKSLKKNVSSITKLVDDVIDLAKIETHGLTLQLETVSVNEYITAQFNMFNQVFEQKNIAFDLFLAKTDASIEIDRLYFGRALNNILTNAHKYTPKGGQVIMKSDYRDERVTISISDNGIGIPQDMLSNIFNYFEQVDNDINKTGGSGIGLSFAQQVIHAHEAKIEVLSKDIEGSTFIITMESVQYIEQQTEETPLKIEEKNKQEIIFIVDDNKEIRTYLNQIFKNDLCYLFADGQAALESIPIHKPSCIISDYMMPNMNGLELVERMREKGYKIPTIILTANTDERTKINTLTLGVDDYLVKPFNETELKLKVSNLIQQKQELLEVSEKLKSKEGETTITKTDLLSIFKLLESTLSREEEWPMFKSKFEELSPNFFTKLKREHASLSKSETRLLVLIHIGFTQKEIANILSIAPDSVKKAKHRVRKKLDLPSSTILTEYLLRYK